MITLSQSAWIDHGQQGQQAYSIATLKNDFNICQESFNQSMMANSWLTLTMIFNNDSQWWLTVKNDGESLQWCLNMMNNDNGSDLNFTGLVDGKPTSERIGSSWGPNHLDLYQAWTHWISGSTPISESWYRWCMAMSKICWYMCHIIKLCRRW